MQNSTTDIMRRPCNNASLNSQATLKSGHPCLNSHFMHSAPIAEAIWITHALTSILFQPEKQNDRPIFECTPSRPSFRRAHTSAPLMPTSANLCQLLVPAHFNRKHFTADLIPAFVCMNTTLSKSARAYHPSPSHQLIIIGRRKWTLSCRRRLVWGEIMSSVVFFPDSPSWEGATTSLGADPTTHEQIVCGAGAVAPCTIFLASVFKKRKTKRIVLFFSRHSTLNGHPIHMWS
ncbi:hypothetical protein BC940DRAFT_111814 [Gongronella butleri]|nr:hypothetical protein BC940DRAFT_111814 [Gongronella butleri]